MSTPTLTPAQFRFHTRAFANDEDPATLGRYGNRPGVLAAAGRALHAALGLGEQEFLAGAGTVHYGEANMPPELEVSVNIAGVAKYGSGEAILISAAGFGPRGIAAWTPDLDLRAPGKPQPVAFYRRRDDGQFVLAPLPTELKAKVEALAPKKGKASTKVKAQGVLCAAAEIYAASFSPDGGLLAAGDGAGRLSLFDVGTGHLLGSVSIGTTPCSAVAFAPDGKTVVAGTNALKVIDAATAKVVRKLAAHGDSVRAVTFSPSGKLLASTGGGKLIVWDRETNQKRHAAAAYDAESLAFIDEDHVITSTTGGIRRFDLTAKPRKHGPPDLEGPTRFASVRDGLLMGTADGALVVYDAKATTPGRTLALGRYATFATDGADLLLGQEVGAVSHCVVVDIQAGSVVRELAALPPTGHGEPSIHGFAFSADGRMALCAGRGITLYNADGSLHLAPVAPPA